MSFNMKDMTHGGQVTFMRFRMFSQITNLVVYYLVIASMFVLVLTVYYRMTWQNMKNGGLFWWCKMITGIRQNLVNEPTYHVDYYGTVLYYTPSRILRDAYMNYCGALLKQELIIALIAAISTFVLGFIITYWFLGREGREQSEDDVIGGRVLSDDPAVVARVMRKRGQASDIKIDKFPIKKDSEIQNFGMHGTVGSGKSQLIRKFLAQCRERNDLVIIYDKGCTFVREFYDPALGDVILNPHDARCANWDLWKECPTLSDMEMAANTLIPMGASEDPFWQGSARTIFAEGADKFRHEKNRTYNKFLRMLLAIGIDKLRKFLEGTPAATLVDGKIEKTAISIRGVLTNYVKAIRYLQNIESEGKPAFTIREWMKGARAGGRNGFLFITSNQRHHESLKPLISMWLSIAANNLQSMGENRHRRVWFWYDELKSLHKLPGLPEIIAEARKFGGCFGLGVQSYPQLEEVYGPKAAEGLFDLLNTKFFFRSPSANVAKFVRDELGETVRKRYSEQTSFGIDQVRDGLSTGKDEETKSIVSYTDIQKLEDLSCYVTLPGDYPVLKLDLKYEERPAIAEELVERKVQDHLDPEIEHEIERREKESANVAWLFDPEAKINDDKSESSTATVPQTLVDEIPPIPKRPKPVSAKPSNYRPTSAAAAAASAGREDEIRQELPLPPGVSDEGEVFDMQAYDEYCRGADKDSRDVARREELNINHSRDTRSFDDIEPGGRL